MRLRIVALLAALALLVGFQVASVETASAAEQTVMIEAKAFAPQLMRVQVGDRVTWMNHDETEHFLSSSGPQSQRVATKVEELEFHLHMFPGSQYTHVFKTPGVYGYFCAIHMGMWGTITVDP